MDNLEISSQIQELLDGESDPAKESEIFARLASDLDARNDFRQFVRIRNAVHHDRSTLAPPVALTNALFNRLGFAASTAAGAVGAISPASVSALLTTILLPAVAGLAALGLATGIQLNDSHLAEVVNRQQPVVSTQDVVITFPQQTDLENRIEELERELAAARLQPPRLVVKKIERPVTNEKLHDSPPVHQAESERNVFKREEPTIARISMQNEASMRFSSAPLLFSPAFTPSYKVPSLYMDGYSVQLRGYSLSNITSVSITPQTSYLSDASLALLYRVAPQLSFGIEVGNETFPQSFEGRRANGQIVRYEQQPASFWAGAVGRYLINTGSPFQWYVQGIAGGSLYGPLARLGAGLTYEPGGPLSFIAGGELTTMFYTYQNQWFTSARSGITFGTIIKL